MISRDLMMLKRRRIFERKSFSSSSFIKYIPKRK